jgi:hypothetical protein
VGGAHNPADPGLSLTAAALDVVLRADEKSNRETFFAIWVIAGDRRRTNTQDNGQVPMLGQRAERGIGQCIQTRGSPSANEAEGQLPWPAQRLQATRDRPLRRHIVGDHHEVMDVGCPGATGVEQAPQHVAG